MANIQVKYNGNVISLSEGTTVEEAKAALANLYPEVANAEALRDEEGNIELKVLSGTKGADEDLRVVYGSTSVTMPAGTSVEDARQALLPIHPEIANATPEEEGNTLRFVVESGTKGH